VTFAVTVHPRALIKYLQNERGFTVQALESGICYIKGDTFPVQILESKLLPPDENLFLHNLRSNLSAEDIARTVDAYSIIKHLELKNVYLNRLMQANPNTFKEAAHMSNIAAQLLYEISQEEGGGWVKEMIEMREKERIARKMLLRGDLIEDVVEMTDLPYETVAGLV